MKKDAGVNPNIFYDKNPASFMIKIRQIITKT